jgi:hypothetical protein
LLVFAEAIVEFSGRVLTISEKIFKCLQFIKALVRTIIYWQYSQLPTWVDGEKSYVFIW